MKIQTESLHAKITPKNLKHLIILFLLEKISARELASCLKEKKFKKDINKPINLQMDNNNGGSPTFLPLEHAVLSKTLILIKILLDAGANPNLGKLALNIAVQSAVLTPPKSRNIYGHIIQLLLDNGANINASSNQTKRNPIHYAADGGDISILEMLLKKGADINEISKIGETAIMTAVRQNHEQCVHFLCEQGAKIKPITIDGVHHSELAHAILNNNEKLAIYLIEYMTKQPFNGMTEMLQEVFEYAIGVGSEKLLSVLLKTTCVNVNCQILFSTILKFNNHNLPRDAKYPKYSSPLHIACMGNNKEIVQLLLDHDADPNQIVNGVSPLTVAVVNKRVNIYHLLLNSGKLNENTIISTNNICVDLDKIDLQLDIDIPIKNLDQSNIPLPLKRVIIFDQAHVLLKHNVANYDVALLMLAINFNALKSVKLLLSFYDPLLPSDELNPLCYAILKCNEPIVTAIIYHLKEQDRMSELQAYLEKYLILFQAQDINSVTINSATANKCILLIKTLQADYFSDPENKMSHWEPNFFPSTSAISYLRTEHDLTYEEIKKMQQSYNDSLNQMPPSSLQSTISLPTSVKGQLLDMNQLTKIEGSHGQNNAYVWLDPEICTRDKCPEMLFNDLEKRFTFSPKCIKKLGEKLDYYMPCSINDQKLILQPTHELKISNSPARILFFPVRSDCNSVVIYLGCKFLPNGLHTTENITSLENSKKIMPIVITLPTVQIKENTLCT